MSEFKIGDKVRLFDCSYSYLVADGKPSGRWGGAPRTSGDYEIVAIGCLLPTNREPIDICCDVPDNNTIIKRLSDNAIIFTQARFLKKRMKKVTIEVRPYQLCEGSNYLLASSSENWFFCGPTQPVTIEVSDD